MGINLLDSKDEELTIEQCRKVLLAEKKILNLVKTAKERLFQEAMAGKPVEGFKLVHGVKHRKYTDEAEARELLIRTFGKASVIEEKIISPAKLDVIMESKNLRMTTVEKINKLIVKPKGGPTLALASDKREEWIDESMFEDQTQIEVATTSNNLMGELF